MTGKGKKVVCYGKQYSTRKQFAEDFGANYSQINYLLNNGFSPEVTVEILTENKFMAIKNLIMEGKSKKEILSIINSSDSCFKESTEEVIEDISTNEIEEVVEDISTNEIVEESEEIIVRNKKSVFYTVNSPSELLQILSDFKFDNINLIDFENMVDDTTLKGQITGENTINIFFYNACIYSNQFFKLINGIENTINIQILTYNVADQLVDSLILYYFGVLVTTYPDLTFNFISYDRVFFNFVDNIDMDNVKLGGRTLLKDKEERFKYCIFKFMKNSNILKNRKCVVKHDFYTIFNEFFNNNLNNSEIDHLIDRFQNWNVVEIVTRGEFEYYKFNMNEIKKFVETFQ